MVIIVLVDNYLHTIFDHVLLLVASTGTVIIEAYVYNDIVVCNKLMYLSELCSLVIHLLGLHSIIYPTLTF